jgi:hypothetical protein
MTERFICDCGQIYGSAAAVRECQAANHSAAAGCELADAERFMRDVGLDPNALTPDEEAFEQEAGEGPGGAALRL